MLDFVARQKVGGTHLNFFIAEQLSVLPSLTYAERDLSFIVPRVLELNYTACDMQPFAKDLGYDGEPFRWDPERRAQLRADLDAYYAYLYGLSKKELRYILDPKDVMGEDYPSETFRVLKEREIREHGLDERAMWRTQWLVLDAYDRFATDGTFNPARLDDPEYFPVVRAALAVSKGREQELERTLEQLVARTDQTPLPTLFVEGETDKLIVEGAWRALYPGEPLPVSVLPAGGTTQMKSLATPGKAMRDLLRDRLVLALADNDAEGRGLWDEGNLHKGGVWKPQTNGVHWCLLKPSDEFTAVMTRFEIPRTCWPFTIENSFPAALRRQALADGAYAFADHKVQSDLTRDPEVAQKIIGVIRDLDEVDDAYFYLMAPTPDAKDAFAASPPAAPPPTSRPSRSSSHA
ncbi:MAG: type modification enzyme [Geminicoccaceae bacterium]|nr:type modification enzyme [Geminicoccaceae bacterium]MCE3249026.1 type modification enzyme [Geminicoccaceae bacterium]